LYFIGKTVNANVIDAVPGNGFTHNGEPMPHYGLKWYTDAVGDGYNMPSAFLNAVSLKFLTGGTKKLSISYEGAMEAQGPFIINSGSSTTQFLHFKNNGTDFAKLGSASGINGGSPADLGVYVYGNNKLELSTNNTKRLVIAGDGKIGIGTESPAAKLNIQIPANEFLFSALKLGTPNDQGIVNTALGAACGGYNIDFATWRDIVPDVIGARIRGERINNHVANQALVQGMDLVFFTSPGFDNTAIKEQVRIKYNGFVGIGTNSPTEKLSVKGKIRAQELRIESDNGNNWPDYVFQPSYKLTPLPELEKFIKTNQHLPEVPSAKEVTANGIEVGANQALLLKKIEEITLHLIELNKKVEELQQENKELKKRKRKRLLW
jgi:hypothetical protein